jgi:hypothetical protein
MRPSTEDLLSIRDGEPLTVETRAPIEESPEAAREVERLRAMQRSLQALPELAPPSGAWERIVAAEQQQARASRRFARAVAGFGAAAAVALVAVIVVVAGPRDDRATIARVSSPVGLEYAEIVAESARLERLLAEIPPEPQVVHLGTVSTIIGLEDQIALLDEQLFYGDAIGLQGAQRAALWSERVDLLNALVLVRAAEAQDNVFETVVGDTL